MGEGARVHHRIAATHRPPDRCLIAQVLARGEVKGLDRPSRCFQHRPDSPPHPTRRPGQQNPWHVAILLTAGRSSGLGRA